MEKKNKVNKENVIDHLIKQINCDGKIENMVEELNLIAKNFEEFINVKEFSEIPNSHIIEIIKRVEEGKSRAIFDYIIKKLKEEKDQHVRRNFIQCIEMKGLNNSNIQELMEAIHFDEIPETLYSTLKDKFRNSSMEMENIKKERTNHNSELRKEIGRLLNPLLNQNQDHPNNQKNRTLLHFAAEKNLIEIGKVEISERAEINAKDSNFEISQYF